MDQKDLLAQAQEIQRQKLLAQAQSVQMKALALTPPPAAQAQPSVDTETQAEAGLQGFGQGGTLGYLPQLQAAFGHAVEKANELVGGQEATPYSELSEYFKKRNERLKEAAPVATAVGNVAGAAATLPTGGAAKGASLLAKVARAAGTGAAYGAAANPEVQSTEADPYAELKARLANAGFGAAAGGLAEGVVGTLGKLSEVGKNLSQKAAIKQTGANAGQIKKILQKNEVPKITEFMGTEGLMSPGKTVDDVMEKTSAILQNDGPQIGAMYDQAQNLANQARGVGIPVKSIDGPALADKIVAEVKAQAKNHPDRNLVNKNIEDAVAPLRDMGANANIVDLHDFRRGLDENINWSQTAKERDAVQRSYIQARNIVADATKSAIDSLDGVVGTKMLDKLKALNARFSTASTVNNIATQGAAREQAKAFMGHGIIGAGAGAGAASVEYKRSHDPLQALGVGLLTAGGVTAARRYGSAFGYHGGKALSRLGQGIEAVSPGPEAVGAGAASPWVMMNQGGY